MTQLKWTEDYRFSDLARSFQATGVGVYDVPDDAVDEYLDHRSGGWELPEDSEASSDESNDFNATAFVDGSWQEVKAKIEDGEADGHLDVVREAENAREDGPREGSVLKALDAREEQE